MPHWSERRERFRATLSGAACVYPGSVFDPVSARIAQDLGFVAQVRGFSVAQVRRSGIGLRCLFSRKVHRNARIGRCWFPAPSHALAGDESRRPCPLKIEPAELTRDIHDFADEVESRHSLRLHRLR